MPQTLLVPTASCPNCWNAFRPTDVRFIAEHASLMGDPLAGPAEGLRFRSSRFDLQGNAIDPEGRMSTRIACPACHGEMPRALLESDARFVSVVGAPGSGKTCLLGAASWSLRTYAKDYGCTWVDVDPRMNTLLHGYESGLFLAGPGGVKRPPKTEVSGSSLYNQITVGGKVQITPKPMFFRVGLRMQGSTVLTLYDNAGEHFLPGPDNLEPLHTRHLGRADALIFVFDPTQARAAGGTSRQELVLIEAMARIRRYGGLDQRARIRTPLIVALTKADTWAGDLGVDLSRRPMAEAGQVGVDIEQLRSTAERAVVKFRETAPELIQSISAFSENVLWVPCSALGGDTQQVQPQWAEVPFLVALDAALRAQVRS
jgi:hypothetical protein